MDKWYRMVWKQWMHSSFSGTELFHVHCKSIVCCQTVRFVLQNYSMHVAKAFNPCCKTVQCKFPNHSIHVAKPFNARFQTIRSVLQNHSIRIAKPFDLVYCAWEIDSVVAERWNMGRGWELRIRLQHSDVRCMVVICSQLTFKNTYVFRQNVYI